jgi:ATP-binding cassette subfamily F protein 2
MSIDWSGHMPQSHCCPANRIAIVGDNGTGKSTLLNLITGQLSPVLGTVSKHPALKLAKYSQHSADQLPYDKSPVEHLEATYKAKYPEKDIQYWRQQVGRFGVTGAHQTNPIAELSDGLRNVSMGWHILEIRFHYVD